MARREAVNAELEAVVVARADDASAWAVYADWLAERGEPRAELIRLQIERAREEQALTERMRADGSRVSVVHRTPAQSARHWRAEDIISGNWSSWFGALPSRAVSCRWRFGFVSDAAFGDVQPPPDFAFGFDERLTPLPAQLTCKTVLELPAMRFLRELRIAASDQLVVDGLDRLPLLDRADIWCSSEAPLRLLPRKAMPALRALRVRTRRQPAALLTELTAPALRELAVHSAADLGAFIEALAGATLLRQLERLCLEVLSPAAADVLLDRHDLFQHLGAGLRLTASDETLSERRQRLRTALPRAQLSPVPPPARPTFRFHGGGPRAHAAPARAPANFRELPPFGELARREGISRDETRRAGSGVPFTGELTYFFHRCMWCASSDTSCIFASWSSSFSERKAESYSFEACEYVCRECGLFTDWESSSEHG